LHRGDNVCVQLIYIDESGDHAPMASNLEYPILVLVACVFDSHQYAENFLPKLTQLKIKHFGHDVVVLHEREIRRPEGIFKFLLNPIKRKDFILDLSSWVRCSGAKVYSLVWDKRIKHEYAFIYAYCLLELLNYLRRDLGSINSARPVIIESRGRVEDAQVAKLLMDYKHQWVPIFAKKSGNIAGLQLADMCARPIGLKVLRPESTNRAFDESIKPLIATAGRINQSVSPISYL
jgi:hypothetical protein